MSKKILPRKTLEQLIVDNDQSVRLVKKKQNSTSSELWEHFHQVFVNNDQQPFVSCNTCKKILVFTSANGTNNLKSHLKSCSKSISICNRSPYSQTTIQEFYSPSKPIQISKKIKSAVLEACTEFAALDGRAFATMKGNGFQSLAQVLFDAGRLLHRSSVQIENILPHPTTVIRTSFSKNLILFRLVSLSF